MNCLILCAFAIYHKLLVKLIPWQEIIFLHFNLIILTGQMHLL